MIPTPVLGALREHLDQSLHRLALPGTDLVRMNLVLRGDLLQRSIPAKRLQRNLRLQLPENRRRLLLICIPPSGGGIHLNDLSDFPGPPHTTASKTWRRLMGNNQLPKVIEGVRFKDGMQIDETKTRAAA